MSKAKEFDIKPLQIWNVHGKFKQPDETVLEDMTVLTMSTLEKGTVNTIIVMGLFKEKNENYKFWECLDIGIEERYLAGDCDIVNIGLHIFPKNVRPYATPCNEA